jgi:hypothetical protein
MEEFLTSLEWQHLLFLFAVLVIFVFRKPLEGLISRITSIDKTGVKTSAAPEAQRELEKKEAAQELLRAIGDSIVLLDVEERIRSSLEEKGLETEGDTISVLIKHLAATQILVEFEQIYNLIFGSQIWLLKKLNELVGQGNPEDFVRSHFETVKELYKDQLGEWSLDQYLKFLLDRSLILYKDGNYHITNLGVEFLTWMARNGRSENKNL